MSAKNDSNTNYTPDEEKTNEYDGLPKKKENKTVRQVLDEGVGG